MDIQPIGQWMIKCSECRTTIAYTDDIQKSYQGGTCKECWIKMLATAEDKSNG